MRDAPRHQPCVALLLAASWVLSSATLAPSVAASDASGIELLTSRLRSSDFRVQVQAALLLGKIADARSLSALSHRLKDDSVAVRAAAAAALHTLGDPAALPALRRAEDDVSPAVRRRIAITIEGLQARQRDQLDERRRAKILVKFASVEMASTKDAPEALGAAAHLSRRALMEMQGIALLNPTEDPMTAARRHDRPVIVMRASVRRLTSTSDGADTVVSADIEYLVESFPGQSLLGRLSGNASARSQVDSKRAHVQLEEDAVGAAVSSALGQSESALVAAAGHG